MQRFQLKRKKRCKRKNIHIVICRAIIVYSVLIEWSCIIFSLARALLRSSSVCSRLATVSGARARLHLNAIGKISKRQDTESESYDIHCAEQPQHASQINKWRCARDYASVSNHIWLTACLSLGPFAFRFLSRSVSWPQHRDSKHLSQWHWFMLIKMMLKVLFIRRVCVVFFRSSLCLAVAVCFHAPKMPSPLHSTWHNLILNSHSFCHRRFVLFHVAFFVYFLFRLNTVCTAAHYQHVGNVSTFDLSSEKFIKIHDSWSVLLFLYVCFVSVVFFGFAILRCPIHIARVVVHTFFFFCFNFSTCCWTTDDRTTMYCHYLVFSLCLSFRCWWNKQFSFRLHYRKWFWS